MERSVGKIILTVSLIAVSALIGCDNRTYSQSVPKRRGAGASRGQIPTLKVTVDRVQQECLNVSALLKNLAETNQNSTEVTSHLRGITLRQTGNSGLEDATLRRFLVEKLIGSNATILFQKRPANQFVREVAREIFGTEDVRSLSQENCSRLSLTGDSSSARTLQILEFSRDSLRFERASGGIVRLQASAGRLILDIETPEESEAEICGKQNIRFHRYTSTQHQWGQTSGDEIMISRALADSIFGAVEEGRLPESIRNKLRTGGGARPNSAPAGNNSAQNRSENRQNLGTQNRRPQRRSQRGTLGVFRGPMVRINASDYYLVSRLPTKPLCGAPQAPATAAPTAP